MRIFFVLLFMNTLAFAQERDVPLLVSPSWLNEHRGDPDLVLLHVAFSRKDYTPAHIPGARFLWYQALVAPPSPDASTEMPSLEQADTVLRQLGIHPSSKIVLYGTAGVPVITRMFFALDYFGLGDQTGILDGGLEEWKRAGFPLTVEVPTASPGTYVPQIRTDRIVDADWIRARTADRSVVIVDARARSYYDGKGGGFPRTGHLPGARNMPASALLDSLNRFRSADELREEFSTAGVGGTSHVITYCHVGQSATVNYVVALLLGYKTSVYDGSFEDWSSRGEEYPLELPAQGVPK